MMVVLVLTQMLGEGIDPLRQQGHLHLGGARVTRMDAKLLDDLLRTIFGQHARLSPFTLRRASGLLAASRLGTSLNFLQLPSMTKYSRTIGTLPPR